MALSSYQFSDLRDNVADPYLIATIQEKVKIFNVLNRSARSVFLDADLRSAKRRQTITPYTIFTTVYDYNAPTDLKNDAVIDLIPQFDRKTSNRFDLVSNEYFDRKKEVDDGIFTITDNSFYRILRISTNTSETKTTVSELDSTTDPNGTWSALADASGLVADTGNYVSGGGSLKFDLDGAATTAGIQNSTLTAIDITDYVNDGAAVVWAYINDTTNLTNFIVRIGSSATAYYQMTTTTQGNGNAFVNGWNQLVFNFIDKTTTGSPTLTSTVYVQLYMTKTSGKSDNGYRFDVLSLHEGRYMDVLYYSSYPWQTNAASYIENATATTDYLNANSEEFDLISLRGRMELARDMRDYNEYNLAKADYQQALAHYKTTHKSERKLLSDSY